MALGIAVSLALILVVNCWHDLDNTEFDCWPISQPNDYNMIDCGGLEMAWVQRPPEKVTNGEEFNVTYSVTASDSFYEYAVKNKIFSFRDGSEAKKFCHEHECPSNWNSASEHNCCVYHANIHSCPLALMRQGGICGPWIPDDGKIVTHTASKAGRMSQQNWTSKVVLIHVGVTSVIAHVKVGQMHAALETKVLVVSAQVCGDDICEHGESCLTCPADCGVCPMSMTIKVSTGLPVALFCTGFILIVAWLQYQKQKMFWDESWIISYKDIMFVKTYCAGFSSTASLQPGKRNSSVSTITDVTLCTVVNTVYREGSIQPGIYDGRTVAVKLIQKKHFTLSKTIRKEVKEVRTLDHPNLCKFIGGSIEVPYISIITEYCPKGSLADVLLNDDIPINWGFRLSFASDLARGMSYLHQHKMFHGRLHSRNCIIDDRWVCKISDYGLAAYRKADAEVVSNSYRSRNFYRIYCAPEVLLGTSGFFTAAADVYSYSIILVEIATRCDLISCQMEVVKLDVVWRPPLPELKAGKSDNDCPNEADYCELIKKCWSHNATMRPTFGQVKKMLEKMNPHKVSPVDMMMNLMEKYSKHLEAVVAERTQDLLQEKQKTDRLLYSMLPKPVADDLRQGRTAEAQSYCNATVYFSDIVGFTQLSGSSTPHQVVDFLNKLYTIFDEIIDNHDVYKVETIGDAYMVVSGVPSENGINHAGEIASMALDLVSVCQTFQIPHKPTTQLKIRAGIHSGPVVAGVVGTKMPRYCLFGDTVNTASRMESTSEALKIQCSGSTADMLHRLGGFILTCRGSLIVKGKGEMKTWWLEAKKGQSHLKESNNQPCDMPVPVSN
ncbi:atrial natriuretic peptide receptor 2-like isoform X2 [Brienomyrus brachyistius]|uniref:atrial natriuretic peptide receptor 2-like isoform X2 n=1 Tax=Brienomyrus brachyistius TaxID=42636 RepID=UPI0020B4125E|nr:atrial natriuretic peptide receptor 2-like isoform X2 [Brienomyrus brachyistius]XP_048860385.1 atrial natriuretic peptide receptor 2-like isoform X2 [Brienomyrus brachyistius]